MKIYRALFWICAITIAILSSIPSLDINIDDSISWDKVAHFTEYFVLSFLYYKYQQKKGTLKQIIVKRLTWMMLLVPIIDEAHQLFIPGRQFSLLDALADTLGFLIIILFIVLQRNK